MTVIWRGDESRFLTAPDVETAAAALAAAPWGRRGYDRLPVDELLALIREALLLYMNEVTGLREEINRLRGRFVTARRGDPADWLANAEDAHAVALTMMSETQAYIDQQVEQARDYCARLTRDAMTRREMILAEAQAQARDAALAAMEEPVAADTQEPLLRAARGKAAYIDTFDHAVMQHIREALSAEVVLIDGILARRQQVDADTGREPGPADRSAIPATRGN